MKSLALTFLLVLALALSGCAINHGNPSAQSQAQQPTLVGAWEVTSSRGSGVGKNLLGSAT